MKQQNLTRVTLLKKINEIETKVGEKELTSRISLVYGFNDNYWRPKLVKKISTVVGVDLLPYVKQETGKRRIKSLEETFKGIDNNED